MVNEKRKLAISGITGVLVACLIIISIVMVPWSMLLTSSTFPKVPGLPPNNSPLAVNVTISNFTEPVGVGSEAEITVTVTSITNASDVKVQITLSPIYMGEGTWPNITWTPVGPCGIDFVNGNSTWIINLTANASTSFTAKIKATEVGIGVIVATATWWNTPSTFCEGKDVLYISVLENEIAVSQDQILPSGFNEAMGTSP